MTSLTFTDKEITYLLLSIKRYETQLLEADEEDMEDSVTDLLFIQALRKKLQEAKNAK